MDLSRASQPKFVPLAILTSVTLLLRILSTSQLYYADGPHYVYAIESGRLVIQPPGYFLFNLCGWVVSRSLHIQAATALQVMNIAFSVAGIAVFYVLASRLLKNPAAAFWLSFAYACSPIVWFAGDIHSSYAAMTLLSPLLLLVLESERRFVLGCCVWALILGFRPSDGAFILPWLLYQSLQFPWKQRIAGASIALFSIPFWWIPTAHRFGGGLLAPLSQSHKQAAQLAQGILTGHLTIHALVTVVHAGLGAVLAWVLLTPALLLGALRATRNPLARSMVIYLAPGLAFFFSYFFPDAVYYAQAVAPGMLLAAVFVAELRPTRQRILYASTVAASLIFMATARPALKPSRARVVADAYLLQYSVHALKQHRTLRVAELIRACNDADTKGKCK